MELDFSIVNVDIYADLTKETAKDLCIKYSVKLSDDPEQDSLSDFRTKLAIVKKNYKKAIKDKSYEELLKKVVYDRCLEDKDRDKHPDLGKVFDITVGFYDEVDSFSDNGTFKSVLMLQSPSAKATYMNTDSESKDLSDLTDTGGKDKKQELPSDSMKNNEQFKVSSDIHKMTSQEQIPLIKAGTFSGSSSEDALEFINKYQIASQCNRWLPKTRLDLFGAHLTGNPYRWYDIYRQEQGSRLNWDDLKEHFLQVFSPVALVEDNRVILENRIQGTGENTLQFLFEIIHLCRKVDESMTESQVIHYFTQAVRPEICSELIKMPNNTLNQLQENIRKIESQNLMKARNVRKFNQLNSQDLNNAPINHVDQDFRNSHEMSQSPDRSLKQDISYIKNTLASLELDSQRKNNKVSFSRSDSNYRDRDISRERQRSKSPHQYRDRQESRSFPNHSQHVSRRGDRDVSRERYRSEERRRYRQDGDNPRIFCDICQKSNHSTQVCRFNLRSAVNNRFNGPRGPSNQRFQGQANSRWCGLCKSNSHNYSVCFKRTRHNPGGGQKNGVSLGATNRW